MLSFSLLMLSSFFSASTYYCTFLALFSVSISWDSPTLPTLSALPCIPFVLVFDSVRYVGPYRSTLPGARAQSGSPYVAVFLRKDPEWNQAAGSDGDAGERGGGAAAAAEG